MKEQMKSLQYETKALEVSEKGIVTVAVNGIGIEDAQHDISMPGSFADTLRDDIAKMRWYLNHDTRQLLGVPLSGEEKDNNLIMTGQLNLKKQIGRDILEDYKLFRDAGRTLEHSIGVKALARDEEDRRKVLKWRMLEYSTLTGWGANPQTYLVGLKSATEQQVMDAVEFIRMALKQHGYSDERLKQYDMELNLLLKALSGGMVVSCPCCGCKFDYDSEPEITFSQEVREAAAEWLRWTARDMARQEMERLRPEIREQVISIIDSLKGDKTSLTEKSITNSFAFVRCPNCYTRVYRCNTVIAADTSATDANKGNDAVENEEKSNSMKDKSSTEPVPSPSFWAQLTAARQ